MWYNKSLYISLKEKIEKIINLQYPISIYEFCLIKGEKIFCNNEAHVGC